MDQSRASHPEHFFLHCGSQCKFTISLCVCLSSCIFYVLARLMYPVGTIVLLTMCKFVSVMGVTGHDNWGQACLYLVCSPILKNNGLSIIFKITDSPLF